VLNAILPRETIGQQGISQVEETERNDVTDVAQR
jgi:hypothetical protein